MAYRSTKTWGHDVGLSACFRQWRAESHCRLLHGYALAVRLEFEADELDERNWVVDFGGLKGFKKWLEDRFDHVLLVAEDDPERDAFELLAYRGVAKLAIVPATGCEAFAKMIFDAAAAWLQTQSSYCSRVRVVSAEVKEHGANSAIYMGERTS